jgi:epoxyqueuosine reductase QueG
MVQLAEHPTVRKFQERSAASRLPLYNPNIDAEWLRKLCLEAGADDVGFVRIEDPALGKERARIEQAFPGVQSLIALCLRMQMENVRSPERSIANQAFHTTGHEVDETCRRIVLKLQDAGIRACNPSMAFPMEVSRIGDDRPWAVSHKLVAVAAGLGQMGIHRSVIHPRFGNFILLGTVLVDRRIDGYSTPIDFNPCLTCKLCVAACPVGAIGTDGHFNAAACSAHNYREFMGGFTDWVEKVADSNDALDYRKKMEDGETLSMWQSLAYGPNYKAAYCIAVCPAGEDVIGPYIENKAKHIERVVRPLREKVEPIYVVRGSDAESYTKARFSHKRLRYINSGIRPVTIRGLLSSIPWLFQRERSAGLKATYHFSFTGVERSEATVVIQDRTIDVRPGLVGSYDAKIIVDSVAWLKYLRRERSLWKLILTGQIKIGPFPGGARLLKAFARCFPS